MVQTRKIAKAARQTAVTIVRTFPIVLGVLALASLMTAAIPPQSIFEALPMESVLGPVFGAVVGSVAAGHPLTSYILAGELTAAGASLATITALIVSWVTKFNDHHQCGILIKGGEGTAQIIKLSHGAPP